MNAWIEQKAPQGAFLCVVFLFITVLGVVAWAVFGVQVNA